MAVYQVISKQLTSNYAVLQLLTPAELEVGQSITVAAVDATFNGTYTIRSLPSYEYIGIDDEGDLEFNPLITIPNQVLYARTAADVARQAASGTLTATPTATWISASDIEDWLGIGTATSADATFLTICASSASQFCWRRRMEAGYVDSLTTVPSQDVKLGTIMYGGALYRQRGSMDSFASFQSMGTAPVMGLNGMIRQLLGIDRPQVA
jgi:hypothetical protein